MFETRSQELLSQRRFLKRITLCLAFGGAMLAAALGLGMLGYHFIVGFGWIDALLNASMILTGMGPVSPLSTDTAKVFASFYALFSGLVFITVMAITLAPIFHRILHRFHLDERDFDEKP